MSNPKWRWQLLMEWKIWYSPCMWNYKFSTSSQHFCQLRDTGIHIPKCRAKTWACNPSWVTSWWHLLKPWLEPWSAWTLYSESYVISAVDWDIHELLQFCKENSKWHCILIDVICVYSTSNQKFLNCSKAK